MNYGTEFAWILFILGYVVFWVACLKALKQIASARLQEPVFGPALADIARDIKRFDEPIIPKAPAADIEKLKTPKPKKEREPRFKPYTPSWGGDKNSTYSFEIVKDTGMRKGRTSRRGSRGNK